MPDYMTSEQIAAVIAERDALKAQLTAVTQERDELRAQATEATVTAIADEVAAANGWKASVLRALVKGHRLELEMRDVTQASPDDPSKSVTVRTAHVRPLGDASAAWEPLVSYVERHLADFLPALRASSGHEASTSGSDAVAKTIERANQTRSQARNPFFPAVAP